MRLAFEETDQGKFCGAFFNLQVYSLFSLLKLPVVSVPPEERTAKQNPSLEQVCIWYKCSPSRTFKSFSLSPRE